MISHELTEDHKEIIKKATIRAEIAGFFVIQKAIDGVSFRKGNIVVIYSIAQELDNKHWIHLSLSRPNKYPTYDEIKRIKEIFIGNEKAIIIFPKDSNFVNLHPYCFHLWSCLDCDIIPDFDRNTGMI